GSSPRSGSGWPPRWPSRRRPTSRIRATTRGSRPGSWRPSSPGSMPTPAGRAPTTTRGSAGWRSSWASPRSRSWVRCCATSTTSSSPSGWSTATRPVPCADSTTPCCGRTATPSWGCATTPTASSPCAPGWRRCAATTDVSLPSPVHTGAMRRISTLVPALLLLLVAACSGAEEDPTGEPTAASPESSQSPSGSDSAEPSDQPEPSATPEPPDPVSIPGVAAQEHVGDQLRLGAVREQTADFTSYDVTWRLRSSGPGARKRPLRLSGVLNVPSGAGPFPAVVLAHGYI